MKSQRRRKSASPSFRGRSASRRLVGTNRPYRRALAFEQLEQRQLLSITVNTLVDENDGIAAGGVSLRDAVAAAASGDTINFSVTGVINLVQGQISINKSLTISGPGPNLVTIDASGNDPTPMINDGNGSRAFEVDNFNFAIDLNVAISGLTLTGGDLASPAGGGAIRSAERLTLTNCAIADNSIAVAGVGSGGGIYSLGILTVLNCSITGNQAPGDGGGIWSAGTGTSVTVANSTISGNRARDDGGGIYCVTGNLTITNSTFSGNQANSDGDQDGNGGAVNHGGSGLLQITGTTVNGNQAVIGGGISCFGPMTLTSNTISNNMSISGGGGVFLLMLDANSVSKISQCTISGNLAGDTSFFGGGGIYHHPDSSGTLLLDHTIVAGNTRQNGARNDLAGKATVRFSLIGDNTGASLTDGGGNLIGTDASPIDAMLGPLAPNGGPTWTQALLAGSPAIDAGDPAAVAGMGRVPLNDQRGAAFVRIYDGDAAGGARIDIGAYERQPIPPAALGDYNANGVVDAADYTRWRDTFGASVTPYSGADGDGDGQIDSDDYLLWKTNFGRSVSDVFAAALVATAPAPSEMAASTNRLSVLLLAPLPASNSRISPQAVAIRSDARHLSRQAVVTVDDALVALLASSDLRTLSRTSGAIGGRSTRRADSVGETSTECIDVVFDALGTG